MNPLLPKLAVIFTLVKAITEPGMQMSAAESRRTTTHGSEVIAAQPVRGHRWAQAAVTARW